MCLFGESYCERKDQTSVVYTAGSFVIMSSDGTISASGIFSFTALKFSQWYTDCFDRLKSACIGVAASEVFSLQLHCILSGTKSISMF